MFGLPDCAAEVLVTFRDRLESLLDVDHGLDLLAAQAQDGNGSPLSYRDYVAAFEKQSYAVDGVYSLSVLQRRRASPRQRCANWHRWLMMERGRSVFGDGSCTGTTDLSIRTRAGRWHHAVEFPVDLTGLDPQKRLRVVVSVVVQKGCVGLGILSPDGASLPEETVICESDGPCLVELVTGRLSQSGSLVVRNASVDGNPSELEMKIVATTFLADSD